MCPNSHPTTGCGTATHPHLATWVRCLLILLVCQLSSVPPLQFVTNAVGSKNSPREASRQRPKKHSPSQNQLQIRLAYILGLPLTRACGASKMMMLQGGTRACAQRKRSHTSAAWRVDASNSHSCTLITQHSSHRGRPRGCSPGSRRHTQKQTRNSEVHG